MALPRNYTWSVPERFRNQVQPGVRVEVVLGKNKRYAGVIRALHNEMPQAFEPKDVLNVLDVEPIVFPHQLQLWQWIAQYYMCSEGEVMAAALPSHFKLSSETTIVFNEEYGEDFVQLDHDEYLVAEALAHQKRTEGAGNTTGTGLFACIPRYQKADRKKVCTVWEALKETYSPKKETYVMLNTAYDNEDALADLLNEDKKLQRAEKQMELLLSYLHLQKTQGEVTKPELLKKSGASDAQLKGLVDKNILWLEKRQIDRLLYLPRDIRIDFTLTPAQEQAYEAGEAIVQNKSR